MKKLILFGKVKSALTVLVLLICFSLAGASQLSAQTYVSATVAVERLKMRAGDLQSVAQSEKMSADEFKVNSATQNYYSAIANRIGVGESVEAAIVSAASSLCYSTDESCIPLDKSAQRVIIDDTRVLLTN
jgi:hypothetical protein